MFVSFTDYYIPNQSRYYLSEYGTNVQLLKFMVRHRKFVETVDLVLTKKIIPLVFIEEVIDYCITHSTLPDLQKAIALLGMFAKCFSLTLQILT
jgi:hypothetical protein